jgi:hypothetical protein
MLQKSKDKKSCSNCIKGCRIVVNNDILCREKGPVSPDYVCSGHRRAPGPKTFKEQNYKCIDCENFIINKNMDDGSLTIGICRLFSVRQFNGTQKNACSKFVKNSEQIVS